MADKKFPFDYFLDESKKELWVKCESSISAMGVSAFAKKVYPDYSLKLCDQKYMESLKASLQTGH